MPVRSPTLPPATHTNVWVVGHHAPYTVFDAASPWPEEQQRLHDALQQLGPIEQLVLTHHHADHIGGTEALATQLGVDVLAHPETASRVPFATQPWEHLEERVCGGVRLRAHHTPGHAPGHLAFQDLDSGVVIAGDMVAGVGTIAIDPADGHLGTYLASLEALLALEATALLPAHGPVLTEPSAVLGFYIAHRHSRSDQIHRALDVHGAATPIEIAPRVYTELDPRFHPLAAVQITSHLIWLREQGRVRNADGRWTTC